MEMVQRDVSFTFANKRRKCKETVVISAMKWAKDNSLAHSEIASVPAEEKRAAMIDKKQKR